MITIWPTTPQLAGGTAGDGDRTCTVIIWPFTLTWIMSPAVEVGGHCTDICCCATGFTVIIVGDRPALANGPPAPGRQSGENRTHLLVPPRTPTQQSTTAVTSTSCAVVPPPFPLLLPNEAFDRYSPFLDTQTVYGRSSSIRNQAPGYVSTSFLRPLYRKIVSFLRASV